MKDTSLYKLGGIAAILVGISYGVIAITSLFIPANLSGAPEAQSPFMYWDANKTLLLTQWWAMLIGAVFALATVPAISATVQHLDEGWVRWASTLAILAFAVIILDNYWSIVYTDARAQAYLRGTEAMRTVLTVPGAPQWIDVQGWLANGAVGFWLLVCSILALRHQAWHQGLAYLGIFGAFLYFLGLAYMVIPDLVVSGPPTFLAVISAIFAPVWSTWMGIHLRRIGSSQAISLASGNRSTIKETL
jgi:hypothetical protein